MISRRTFIQTTMTSVVLGKSSLLRAQQLLPSGPDSGNFFVQISVDGGLDVTLGLDPQGLLEKERVSERELYLGYSASELALPTDSPLILGPSALPLASLRSDLCIINGILTSEKSQAHPDNANHMRAGYVAQRTFDSMSLPVSFAAAKGPKPYNVVAHSERSSFFPLVGPEKKMKIFMLDQLESSSVEGPGFVELADFWSTEEDPESSLAGAFRQGMSQAKKRPEVIQAFKKLSAVSRGSSWMGSMAAFFLTNASDFAEIALSPPVDAGYVDSHSDHLKNHKPAQQYVWERIAELFRVFKAIPYGKGSLFDATTFMVSSEFSRTPFLNRNNGKDHNPLTNSVLLAGFGIRGGQVIGRSHLYTADEIKMLIELKKKQGRPEDQIEAFASIFTESDIRSQTQEIRSGHIGSAVTFDNDSVARPLEKFQRGGRITPGMVALTVQKAVGISGDLPGLEKETRWLQQALKS